MAFLSHDAHRYFLLILLVACLSLLIVQNNYYLRWQKSFICRSLYVHLLLSSVHVDACSMQRRRKNCSLLSIAFNDRLLHLCLVYVIIAFNSYTQALADMKVTLCNSNVNIMHKLKLIFFFNLLLYYRSWPRLISINIHLSIFQYKFSNICQNFY